MEPEHSPPGHHWNALPHPRGPWQMLPKHTGRDSTEIQAPEPGIRYTQLEFRPPVDISRIQRWYYLLILSPAVPERTIYRQPHGSCAVGLESRSHRSSEARSPTVVRNWALVGTMENGTGTRAGDNARCEDRNNGVIVIAKDIYRQYYLLVFCMIPRRNDGLEEWGSFKSKLPKL